MARASGSLCTLLLAWLCALGAGPVRHPATTPVVVRSAVELALRDVADAPQLASRLLGTRVGSSRPVERDAATWPLTLFAAPTEQRTPLGARAVRATLNAQAIAHAARPRWRAYDAIAPPALSRTAR